MRFYQKILWGLGVFGLALLSLVGFLVVVGLFDRFVVMGWLTFVEQTVLTRSIILLIFGFLFGLSLYLPFLTRTTATAGGAVISLKNPLGAVEISQKAISEFIQRIGKEVEGVEDIKAAIKSSDEGVDVYLTLSAQAQGEVPRLIDELQTVVKTYLNKTVGIENVREIKVRVAKLI
ncbi:MAG: alkaline shock response membrane anchor protein AmaP [bacterium]